MSKPKRLSEPVSPGGNLDTSKPKLLSEPVSPGVNLDVPFETGMNEEEYDEKGWLDCNPEAKMHLSHLDKEEYISDDETEVMPYPAVCLMYMVPVDSNTINRERFAGLNFCIFCSF